MDTFPELRVADVRLRLTDFFVAVADRGKSASVLRVAVESQRSAASRLRESRAEDWLPLGERSVGLFR